MNILVIDGHPDTRRTFCHALSEAYMEGARHAGHQTRFIRLADTHFSVLRSASEFAAAPTEQAILSARDDIIWAEQIAIVFPLWMGTLPAYSKAFLEQVARAEFFAQFDGRRLTRRLSGKSARLIVTMGMPSLIYRLAFGAYGVKVLARSILAFAGAGPVRTTLIGGVEASESNQQRRIAQVRALGANN